MYLSKITYSPSHRAEMVEALTSHQRNLFNEHEMIWQCMPQDQDAERDFLYRRDENSRQPFYYLLSARKPENWPEFLQVETKVFAPKLETGGHYGFSLRANAVVTRKVEKNSKRRIRRDIVEAKVDEYKQRFPNPQDRPPSSMIHHEAGEQWLKKQGEKYGFRPLSLIVSNHQYFAYHKKGNSAQRQFASLDFDGVLEVTEPLVFTEAMYTGRPNKQQSEPVVRGMGRSMAYGCGLMLIKKALR
ncbi:type I-E CRISPR-associated protein Cas6/Cse3/CasE [Porticoccus sp.]